jgi:hypothetical protein
MQRSFMTAGVAALLICGAAASAAAQGCGPTRLKVTQSVTLDMPPAQAWALVGNFQDTRWAQNTRAVSGAGGNVPDKAVRKTVLRDGAVLEESLYKYNAETMSYAYHIDKVDVAELPVQNTSVTVEVVPAEGGSRSTVQWRAAFYRFLAPGEPAPDVADSNAAKAVTAFGKQTLEGLKSKSEAKT